MEWTSVQLRSLVELSRRGTMSDVARTLGYTTGGVSQQIAALERSAGVPLLRRVGRRVQLSDAGLALAVHAERMLATEAEAIEDLERAAGEARGVLRVGVFASVAAEILPAVLRHVETGHPGLILRCRDMDAHLDAITDAVLSGSLDLAMALDYPDVPIPRHRTLAVETLFTEPFGLAAAAEMLPSATSPLGIDAARSHPWILPPEDTHYGRAMRTACRRHGFEPDVHQEVADTAALLSLVEAGVGVSLVTDLMLRLRRSNVAVARLVQAVERHVVVVVRHESQQRPSVAAVLTILRQLAIPADCSGPRQSYYSE